MARPRQECLDTILPVLIFHDGRTILWRLDDEIDVDLAVKPETTAPSSLRLGRGPAALTTAR